MLHENEQFLERYLQSTETARLRLLRRQPLRPVKNTLAGRAILEVIAAAMYIDSISFAGGLGGIVRLRKKDSYAAALPEECDLGDGIGVYYENKTQSYIVHLDANTNWSFKGEALDRLLRDQWIVKDPDDGSFWVALYHRCGHFGCKIGWLTDIGLLCPCHGCLYNVIGEWLGGPAPRSLDRFKLSFDEKVVVIDTNKLNQRVLRPNPSTRLQMPSDVQAKFLTSI